MNTSCKTCHGPIIGRWWNPIVNAFEAICQESAYGQEEVWFLEAYRCGAVARFGYDPKTIRPCPNLKTEDKT